LIAPTRETAEIVVAGGGCAAFAAALTLARKGADVVVVATDDSSSGDELPETIGQAAVMRLCSLGLAENELRKQLVLMEGRLSRWGKGSARFVAAEADFHGSSYLLGKRRLARMLAVAAEARGAGIVRGKLLATDMRRDGAVVQLMDDDGQVRRLAAGALIDATGRRSAIARSAGVRRRSLDRLVSFWLTIARSPARRVVAVQTVSDGWLFLAPRSQGGLALGFFTAGTTTSGLPSAADVARRLAEAPELACLAGDQNEWWASGPPTTRNAATTLLEAACGERWIACGDALQTVDPLASAGLLTALTQAQAAADAALTMVAGDRQAAGRYGVSTFRDFMAYWQARGAYYSGQSTAA
jgi:flavin-dependent dehydrogenase